MSAPDRNGLDALAEVMGLLGKATEGRWMLATSCSWRRVLTESGREVIVPTTQQSDGHPDLDAGLDHVNAEAAIAAVNYLRKHGEAIRELVDATSEILEKKGSRWHPTDPTASRARAALAKFTPEGEQP